MVLLTQQDTTIHTRFSRSGTALGSIEKPDVTGIAAALQKAASFDTERQTSITTPSYSNIRRASGAPPAALATAPAASDTDAGADNAAFIVSGPLLPIRQARRGINANRNYRIFGTPPLAEADMQQQHTDAIDAMFAPPTPVSASASSASYSSRAAGPGSRLGSGSSRASSKSTASAVGSVSDTLSTTDEMLAGGRRQIRVCDKHQIRGLTELAMEPIVLSAHARSHSSTARTPHAHGAESDGRSGSVRVSSLLPSARSSPMISSRRGLSKSVSPRGSLAPAVGAGLAAHQYHVQRVPVGPLSEKERLSNELAARTAKDERRAALRGSRRRPSANPLLAIGTQIAPGHANYVLMYNMLTGIRVSVSRCEAKDSRPVRLDDYSAQHKYSFDVVGDEMTPSSRYDFKFKDYAPWVFRCIREAFHLSTEEYLVSLTDKYILSEVGSSGKSGSFFYYSQDYRFIIKTVHHTEHKFMRQILPQYYEFVRDHPNTLLSRIYGLHRIKLPHGRKVHFIVMSNILPPNKDIHAQFDLKGSLLGRELSPEQAAKPRACMKDKNWVNTRQRLHFGPQKRRAFVKQLIEDVTLLIRLNIMDYSLLVGVHDLNKGNVAKLRDTTLAMFDPQTTDIQQLNRLTRAHTIRKKVVHTDPVTLDALPHGTVPPLPESMFPELRHSIFYREDGGILSADPNGDPAQLIYYLGVIDILTPYNMVKRTEHVVKAIVHDGSQISAINPR
ncbi:Phosphatidylinositol-4-phosphate 5-kinase, partial [Coemansia aciculifera]